MASTHFTTGTTITSEWLNDVNDAVYEGNITAEGVQYTPPFTGGVTETVEAKLAQTISVKDFGAVGDGVTDDTQAIQNAIDSGAKQIIGIASETYRITDTLTIDADKVEFNLNHAELLLDDPSGLKDHLFLGNGTTQRGGIKIYNVVFTRAQVATAGWAINSNLIGVCEIIGCRIYGNNEIYNGIQMYRAIMCTIEDNYIDNCIRYGIYLEGSGTGADRTVDVTIRENRVDGCQNALVTWDFVEGLFCRDNIFFNQSVACAAINASSNANGLVSFKLQENDFDTAPTGLYIKNVNNIQITDCWFSNLSNKCLLIDQDVNGVVIADNQMYISNRGIESSAYSATITGNMIAGNGTGILFTATASHNVVNGNVLQTATGLDISLNPTYMIISNNDFNNSVGSISGSGGTGTIIEGNRGDSVTGKTNYITVGASPFTYTTGPRPETVSITAGDVTSVYIDSKLMSGRFLDTATFTLPPNTSMVVTYAVIPYMTKLFL